VARNRAHGARRVALFELGKAYLPALGNGRLREERRAATVLFSDDPPARWGDPPADGLLNLKGRVESALMGSGLAVAFQPGAVDPFAPGLCLVMLLGSKPVGHLGTLSPALLAAVGLKGGNAHYAEWRLDGLSPAEPHFEPFSKYPPVVRDFSFLVPASTTWDEVRLLLEGLSLENLLRLELMEVYEGKGIPDGMRSWTFSLVFQSIERTLTEEDIAPQAKRVAGAMGDALRGVQR
jgi:phenylalanyl-tRNA synthetase beta chain